MLGDRDGLETKPFYLGNDAETEGECAEWRGLESELVGQSWRARKAE
jgi:hypothetical protein